MRKRSDCQQIPSFTIRKRIHQAQSLYDIWGDAIRQDPYIRPLLQRFQTCVENTGDTMLALGVVAECQKCEEDEGGSCCGAGIENKYEPVLLLINLLLGSFLPTEAPLQNDCYFLGKTGCLLAARHVLCVNYICEKLKKKLSIEELIGLQNCAGEELDTLFLLHEAIKKKIRT